jgi:hypothetical protein
VLEEAPTNLTIGKARLIYQQLDRPAGAYLIRRCGLLLQVDAY